MNIKDWEIIYTLFIYKNITKTAKKLFISQPALTVRIQKIEQELGVTLLMRNNKGIEFTLVGEYVAQYAKEVINSFKLLKEKIKIMDNEVSGTLRIVAPYIFSKYRLTEILVSFQKKYPHVDFDIIIKHSSDIFSYLKGNFCHFGFVRNANHHDEYNKLLVESDELFVVYKNAFSLDELPYLRRIEYQTDSEYKLFLDDWWKGHFEEVPIIGIKVGDLDTCRELVFAGMGYAFLPRSVIPTDRGLSMYPVKNKCKEAIMRYTWMIYEDKTLERPLQKLFYEHVKKLPSAMNKS